MRHYEIVLLIHPDQSEQVPTMVARYKKIVTEQGGVVHRFEDWGRRLLAYQIKKLFKAHYVLLNVECSEKTIAELASIFRFNDAVVRHLILKVEKAETEPSVMMKESTKREAPAAKEDPKESLPLAEETNE